MRKTFLEYNKEINIYTNDYDMTIIEISYCNPNEFIGTRHYVNLNFTDYDFNLVCDMYKKI